MNNEKNGNENNVFSPLMEKFIKIVDNQNFLSILLILKLFSPLNLTSIAEYMDKGKSNTLYLIDQLIELQLITEVRKEIRLNVEKGKRGPKKYYILTKDSEIILNEFFSPYSQSSHQYIDIFEKITEKKIQETIFKNLSENSDQLDAMKLKAKLVNNLHYSIERIISKNYEVLFDEIKNWANESKNQIDLSVTKEELIRKKEELTKSIPIIEYNQIIESLPIYNKEQALEITKLVHQFYLDLMKIKENRIKEHESKKDNAISFQHVYLFLGPLNQKIV